MIGERIITTPPPNDPYIIGLWHCDDCKGLRAVVCKNPETHTWRTKWISQRPLAAEALNE